MKRAHRVILVALIGLGLAGWLISSGCDGTGSSGQRVSLFSPSADTEKWTIECIRIEQPGHVQQAETLANMLRQVKQLDPKAVRVGTDETGSSVYYGEYRRVPSSRGGDQLVFPQEYQRDIAFIRSLSDGVSDPFRTARIVPVESDRPIENPQWEATQSQGTHSLLVAVFYNTEGFQQRKEVAEQYVGMLREEGFPAYYYHEPVKSFVFVGDFTVADLVNTPEGLRPGPRVEQMIARRPDEFRHFMENGHIRRHFEGGREVAPPTLVVPMPRKDPADIK